MIRFHLENLQDTMITKHPRQFTTVPLETFNELVIDAIFGALGLKDSRKTSDLFGKPKDHMSFSKSNNIDWRLVGIIVG
jgi:hypothetical protein